MTDIRERYGSDNPTKRVAALQAVGTSKQISSRIDQWYRLKEAIDEPSIRKHSKMTLYYRTVVIDNAGR